MSHPRRTCPFTGNRGVDNPLIFAGFMVSNSETGHGSFSWSAVTQAAQLQVVVKQARDAVTTFLDRDFVIAKIAEIAEISRDAAPSPIGGRVVDLRDVHALRDVVGERVSAQGALVQSVPADEGFWVTDGGDRVWVQIRTTGEARSWSSPGRGCHSSGRSWRTVRTSSTGRTSPRRMRRT